jgi:Ca2+-binding EF-hand superfamily protein
MDSNRDGKVDFKEFSGVWQPSMLETGLPEAYKPVEDLFKQFDADGDGAITKVEFTNAMKRQNPSMPDKEILSIMKRMDTNEDGNIDFTEFATMEFFKQFDVDNDGEITASEFKAGMNKLNPSLTVKHVDVLFKQMDTNNDGHVDFGEFFSAWRPKLLTNEYPEAYKPIRELFEQFDADGDGAITKTEFKNAMKKRNAKLFDKEITKMMERMDTNGDGTIDFKEFATMEIFRQFDADNDGEITDKEFKGGMTKLNPSLSVKDVEMLFKFMDGNKDGRVDFKEFNNAWRPKILEAKYPEVYKQIQDLFKQFDADGDGSITKTEFKNAMKRQDPKLQDKDIEAMMKRMDTNGDGNIDFKEFAAMEIFKQFDVDNDGEITAAEFKGGLTRLNPSMTFKEIETLFKQMDSNNDGKIDFKEFDIAWRPSILDSEYPEAYKPIRELFE